MINKKIKGSNAQNNMRAREFWDCSERNVCAVWLALLSMGVSKNQILAIDDEFHDKTVIECRQDAEDDVAEVRLGRFMQSVGLSGGDIVPALEKYKRRINRAFPTGESYALAMQALRADFIMMLMQLNRSLGYGNKRLKRVISFVSSYDGDPKDEVARELNIYYPPPDTLPDTSDIFAVKKRKRKELEQATMLIPHIS